VSDASVWQRARAGYRFSAGSTVIDADTVRAVVQVGGFSHPLFTDDAYARERGFTAAPLPGQALLVIMGGLVESTGEFNVGVRALLGYREVEFGRRVCAGDELRLDVALVGTEEHPDPGLGVVVARFVGTVDGETACTALVRHLVDRDDAD
jgi:acyl dehydratase